MRSGKLLGFVVSGKGIEVDPAKVKAIQEMPKPRTEKQVRGFLGRLNYIARFISHLTTTCEPIFKLLRKDRTVRGNNDCQAAFGNIKRVFAGTKKKIGKIEGFAMVALYAIYAVYIVIR